MIWADLASDVIGVLIFVTWLAIPPIYVMILGRHYVRRCRRELEGAEFYVDNLTSGRHRRGR